MTTENSWLESARRLMDELSQQSADVQQSMRDLSRRSYSQPEIEAMQRGFADDLDRLIEVQTFDLDELFK